jgi:hypothetical protein
MNNNEIDKTINMSNEIVVEPSIEELSREESIQSDISKLDENFTEKYNPKTIFGSHENLEINENLTTVRDIKNKINTNVDEINDFKQNNSSIQKEQEQLIKENDKIYHELKIYEKKINELKKINKKIKNELHSNENGNFFENIKNKFEMKLKQQKYNYNNYRIQELDKKYAMLKNIYLYNNEIINNNNKETKLFNTQIKAIKNENAVLDNYIHEIQMTRQKTEKAKKTKFDNLNKTKKNVTFRSTKLTIPVRKLSSSSKTTIPLEEPDDVLPPLEEPIPLIDSYSEETINPSSDRTINTPSSDRTINTPSSDRTINIPSSDRTISPIVIKRKGTKPKMREIDKKLYERQKKLERDKKERQRILKQIALDKEMERRHLERLVQFNSFKYPENKHCPAGFSRDPQTRRCVKRGVKLHNKTKKQYNEKVRYIKKIDISRKHKQKSKNKTRKISSPILKKPRGSNRCPNGYKINKETNLCVKKGEKIKFIKVAKKDLLKYK